MDPEEQWGGSFPYCREAKNGSRPVTHPRPLTHLEYDKAYCKILAWCLLTSMTCVNIQPTLRQATMHREEPILRFIRLQLVELIRPLK